MHYCKLLVITLNRVNGFVYLCNDKYNKKSAPHMTTFISFCLRSCCVNIRCKYVSSVCCVLSAEGDCECELCHRAGPCHQLQAAAGQGHWVVWLQGAHLHHLQQGLREGTNTTANTLLVYAFGTVPQGSCLGQCI